MRPIAWAVLAVACLASQAAGQRIARVSTDESVIAADALIRVRELADADNTAEAVRVLQSLLDNEGDSVIPTGTDPELFVAVRRVVHDLLRSRPALLAKYRQVEGPRGEQMLKAGELAELERTRLLTSAGFEAALRRGQLDVEGARFEAARLMLMQLESHPERAAGSAGARDAALLAAQTAAFLDRPQAREWAARWAREAGPGVAANAADPTPPAQPPAARSALDPGPALDPSRVPPAPLQSVPADSQAISEPSGQGERSAWVLPTVHGDRAYVNDGSRVWAWDAATLSTHWVSDPGEAAVPRDAAGADFGRLGSQGWIEDTATVAVDSGVVVAPLGIPESGTRRGDRRVHAVAADSGRLLWAVDPSEIDRRLDEASVRGPAQIDGGTVVLALRKASMIRRTSTLFLVGLDLYSGRERWVRMVGSLGTNPWGRPSVRPDAGVLHRGVVYRGDDMGLIAAYEAGTGRPLWVRVTRAPRGPDMTLRTTSVGIPPFETSAPLIVGDDLFFIEPGRERVLRLAVESGEVRGSRESSALFEPRYLLHAGEHLAAVGSSRVATVRLSEFESGTVRSSAMYGGSAIRGRAVVAGASIILPVEGGAALIDPASPERDERLSLPTTGNIVLAGGEPGNEPAHLLVTDPQRLHSYVSWAQAERMLTRRVQQSPGDPGPLLTYVELLHRSGHADRVPEVADRAMRLVGGQPIDTRASDSRARLFDLLVRMVRGSREAISRPGTPTSPLEAPPIRDLPLLDAIMQRLAASAQRPAERAAHWLEQGWLRELQARPADAVEAYQQVLLDPSLAEVGPYDDPDTRAGARAEQELSALLRRVGSGAYAAFDEEARLEAEHLAASADARSLEALARRYPAAAVAPDLWLRAAEAHARAASLPEARQAAGSGLAAAELSTAIGRPGQLGIIGRLAGTLITLSRGRGDQGAVFRVLHQLARTYPDLVIPGADGPAPIAAALELAARSLRERSPLPRLGSAVAPGGQVIEGWEPAEAIVRGLPGCSTDSLILTSDLHQQAGLWAVRAEDGLLHPVWARPARTPPTPIRVGHEHTLLFWPTLQGGWIECVGLDGSTVWRSQDFYTLFDAPPELDPNDRIPTPLEGHVRPESLVMSLGERSLVLVQRTGFAAGFDLVTGRPLWRRNIELSRVYDVAHCDGVVVVIGAVRSLDGQLSPAALCLDGATGERRARVPASVLGDHPRWVRSAPGNRAILATSDGLVCFDPRTGSPAWTAKTNDLRATSDGWVVGSAIFVLDSELRLWRVALEGGAVSERPVDTRDKLTLPVTATVQGDRLVLATSQGVAVIDERGRLVGADSLDSAQLEMPVVGEGVMLTIETPIRDFGAPDGSAPAYRLLVLDNPTGRLLSANPVRLYDTPRALMALDGKIIVSQGVATLVFDAPPQ